MPRDIFQGIPPVNQRTYNWPFNNRNQNPTIEKFINNNQFPNFKVNQNINPIQPNLSMPTVPNPVVKMSQQPQMGQQYYYGPPYNYRFPR